MMLTPEQSAKIARLWVPVAGHLYVDPDDENGGWWRVLEVVEGQITEMACEDGWICKPEDMVDFDLLAPCYWGDHATADGLPRTARAAWSDPTLHVTPTLSGKWTLNRIVGKEWQTWLPDGFAARIFANRDESVRFDSEHDALIAAILAAPEPA